MSDKLVNIYSDMLFLNISDEDINGKTSLFTNATNSTKQIALVETKNSNSFKNT